MKIFVSSLVSGFEDFRAAARAAIVSLGHQPVMVEDFGAVPMTPQIACMQGLRSADIVVLILGANYGYVQGTSGVSPTHEEYLEARGRKPILMFTQQGVQRDEQQAKFVADAQAWQGGNFRAAFVDAEELRTKITQALHQYELANAAGPVDPAALVERAASMLPRLNRQSHPSGSLLHLAMASGPSGIILRPAQLETPMLAKAIHQHCLFGENSMFDPSKGVRTAIEDSTLVVEQEAGARVQLGEDGGLLVRIPVQQPAGSRERGFGMLVLIEENVERALTLGFGFANWTLDHIDETHRLTHVGIAAFIESSEYMGWMTQAEQEASHGSMTMGMGGREKQPVALDKPRAALAFQGAELAEDFMVRLRRQWKPSR